MTGEERPLLEEPVEVLAGDVAHGPHEILGLDHGEGMAFGVLVDRRAVEVVAQQEAQHVQHARALVVHVGVVARVRAVVEVDHERARAFVVGRDDLAVRIPHLVAEGVVAVAVLLVEVRVVRGESLVEPHVAPLAAGEHVAVPLVGELVGDEVLLGARQFLALVVQGAQVHHRGGGVLHAAVDEVLHDDLRVLGVRVVDANLLREVLHHVAGEAVAAQNGGVVRVGGHHVPQRNVPPLLLVDPVLRDRQHDEVAHLGLVELPEELGVVAGLPLLDQAAVGDRRVTPRHAEASLERGLVVRVVVAGDPVAVVFPLALGPDLEALLGDALLGGDPVETDLRRAAIMHRDRDLRAALEGLVQPDDELVVRDRLVGAADPRRVLPRRHRVIEGGAAPVDRDGIHGELDTVETDLAQPRSKRAYGVGDMAGDAPVFEVDVEVEGGVQRPEGPAGRHVRERVRPERTRLFARRHRDRRRGHDAEQCRAPGGDGAGRGEFPQRAE